MEKYSMSFPKEAAETQVSYWCPKLGEAKKTEA